MADFLLLYYSGAGNTQYVAGYIKRTLEEKGHTVTSIFAKRNTCIRNIEEYDGIIIGSPVYAYRAPPTLLEVIKGLPQIEKPIYLFFTKGLILGNSAYEVFKILKLKGYKIIGFSDIIMADTLFLLTSNENTILHKLYLLPNKIFKHKIRKLPEKILTAFDKNTEVQLRKKIYVPLTNFIARKFWNQTKKWIPKFHADEKCTLCGACVELCPTFNIKIKDDKVIFGNDCEFCLRCFHRCPERAIQIDNLTQYAPRYKPNRINV